MAMRYDTVVAYDLTKIFGGTVGFDATLGDVFDSIVKGEVDANELSVVKDNGLWLELDDGMTFRSVIRDDKKTYHQGCLMESFGALKDSTIPLGKNATTIEVPLVDKQGRRWEVLVQIWGDSYRQEGMEIMQVNTPTGQSWRSEIDGDPIWAHGDDQVCIEDYIN